MSDLDETSIFSEILLRSEQEKVKIQDKYTTKKFQEKEDLIVMVQAINLSIDGRRNRKKCKSELTK